MTAATRGLARSARARDARSYAHELLPRSCSPAGPAKRVQVSPSSDATQVHPLHEPGDAPGVVLGERHRRVVPRDHHQPQEQPAQRHRAPRPQHPDPRPLHAGRLRADPDRFAGRVLLGDDQRGHHLGQARDRPLGRGLARPQDLARVDVEEEPRRGRILEPRRDREGLSRRLYRERPPPRDLIGAHGAEGVDLLVAADPGVGLQRPGPLRPFSSTVSTVEAWEADDAESEAPPSRSGQSANATARVPAKLRTTSPMAPRRLLIRAAGCGSPLSARRRSSPGSTG